MSAITLAQAQNMLNTWMAAETSIAKGQSYSIEGMTVTRANLGQVADRIKFWRSEVERLSAGTTSTGPRVRRVIPRDL